MRFSFVFLLALGACATPAKPSLASDTLTPAGATPIAQMQVECEAKGGVFERPGDPIRPPTCVIRQPDGGMSCQDGSQCQSGICEDHADKPRTDKRGRVFGHCSYNNYFSSCSRMVTHGVRSERICF
jgi:hypothetical protein